MTAEPETVGLSGERLKQLDSHLAERWISPGRIPGALVLVHRRGQTVHLSCQGHADRERRRPVTPDTVFRIYSMTKPIASLAFMMLVEAGRVALDDPVARFIPEWDRLGVYEGGEEGRFRTRPCSRPMLIVDLLRHTSGLTYGIQQRTPVDAAYRAQGVGVLGADISLDETIARLAKLPLEFSPGDAWNYSVATDVVGYLIGEISGQPFETFLAERIFAPLGMGDTGFSVPPGEAGRLAACYSAAGPDGLKLFDDPQASPYLAAPALVSGGGGLVSTAADYLRFCRMLIGGGKLEAHRLVSRKTFALMSANHLPGGRDLASMSRSLFSEATNEGVGFGLGFAVTLDPGKTLLPGSAGDMFWGGAAGTYFWVDPAEELIVIFMTQALGGDNQRLRRELRTLVYGAFDD